MTKSVDVFDSIKHTNHDVKKLLIDAFFYDMVHDFMEENPISGNMRFDIDMLFEMFRLVFGQNVTDYVRNESSIAKILDIARSNLYRRCTDMNKFFGMIDVKPDLSTPGRTKNYVPSILKHSEYNDIARFSNVLYHQNAVHNVLYTPPSGGGVQQTGVIELVENAQKSARAIPALFGLTTMNKKGFPKKAVPIDVISGRYDQASKKFSILFTKKFNILTYKLGNINVAIQTNNANDNVNFISQLYDIRYDDKMYSTYMRGSLRNKLIQFFKDKFKGKQINYDSLTDYMTPAEIKKIGTIDVALHRFFPSTGVFDTKLLLRFMKNKGIRTKKNGYLNYIRSSITSLSNQVYPMGFTSFKDDFRTMYTNSQSVEAVATLRIDNIQITESKPSVKNVVTKLRNFIIGTSISSSTNGDGTRVPSISSSDGLKFRRSFKQKYQDRDFVKKCFLILFSKTIGDFSQIVETMRNDNRYLVTFDKMAAIIALVCDCKTIFVGDNKYEINTGMGSNSYGNFQKQGFAAVGPVHLLTKRGVRAYNNKLNSNNELVELQTGHAGQKQFNVRETTNNNRLFDKFLLNVNTKYIKSGKYTSIDKSFFNMIARNKNLQIKFKNKMNEFIQQIQNATKCKGTVCAVNGGLRTGVIRANKPASEEQPTNRWAQPRFAKLQHTNSVQHAKRPRMTQNNLSQKRQRTPKYNSYGLRRVV